jgi:Thioesterase domain
MAKPKQASAQPKSSDDHAPPSLALLAMEIRAPWEFGALLPAWPALQRAPRGDGHTVVVYPGLSASDATTIPLRKYLTSLGYSVHGWGQGFNFGPRAGVLGAGREQLRALLAQSKQPISLVGWSLGGIYARELAKELADEGQRVRSVITLGTPFAGGPRSTNAWRLYELTSGRSAQREAEKFELHIAPSVPTSSIYSRSDGIVAWQASLQAAHADNPHTENIEVVASHFGIGLNPSAWWAVADRLAQVPGRWQAFQKPSLLGLQSLVYPDPARI